MKKNLIFSICLFLGISSGFAQEGKIACGATTAVRQGVVPKQVLDKVRRAIAAANAALPAGQRLVQITNLPGRPVVRLKTDLPASSSDILQARMLTGKEISNNVFSERWSKVQVPLSFNREEGVLFKGLRLRNLGEIKNILKNGLEIKKRTRFPVVFVTTYFVDAIGSSAALYGNMSVVVKVSLSPDIRSSLSTFFVRHEYMFRKDVPAANVLGMVVFMEVEGVGNWYQVTLENGTLVLESTPNAVVKMEEVIEQQLNKK